MHRGDFMRKSVIVVGAVVCVGVSVWFQNCMSAAKFKSMLRAAYVNANGDIVDQPEGPGTEGTPADPTPTPGDGPATPTPTAGEDPTPTPTATASPSATSSPAGSGSEELCLLLNESSSGKNKKVGVDVVVVYQASANGVPGAVCMSANACLNIVNDYLNLTAGVFGAPAGQPGAVKQQYTMQKLNAVCENNPTVVHMTDDQVTQEILKLKAGN
jgi:hypothetical protein